MNTLVVGSGKGSWLIRGVQLGAAIGARVVTQPTEDDWHWADLAILVKRAGPIFAPMARAAGVPIVWDALDFWRQPTDHTLIAESCRQALRHQIRMIQPAEVIGATNEQAKDAGGVYLPHHSRLGLRPRPIRRAVEVVAYEGAPAYLGRYLEWVSVHCGQRGWRFVINPADLSEADIVVALRDGAWDGWMPRTWKSGVKLVNAIAAGRPVLVQECAAAAEIRGPASWVDSFAIGGPSPLDVAAALDFWADPTRRQDAADECAVLATQYEIAVVAEQYRRILTDVRTRCLM